MKGGEDKDEGLRGKQGKKREYHHDNCKIDSS